MGRKGVGSAAVVGGGRIGFGVGVETLLQQVCERDLHGFRVGVEACVCGSFGGLHLGRDEDREKMRFGRAPYWAVLEVKTTRAEGKGCGSRREVNKKDRRSWWRRWFPGLRGWCVGLLKRAGQ